MKRKRNKNRTRALTLELLGERVCLAGDVFHDAHLFRHNFARPHDVNQDGAVSPVDALMIINALNRAVLNTSTTTASATDSSATDATGTTDSSTGCPDVDADAVVTPKDALMVINVLNGAAVSTTEATTASTDSSSDATVTDTSTATETTTDATGTSTDSSTTANDTTDDSITDSTTTSDDAANGDCPVSTGTTTTTTSAAGTTTGTATSTAGTPTLTELPPALAQYDANGDNALTQDEVTTMAADIVSKLDTDASGGFSLTELAAAKQAAHAGHHVLPTEAIISRFDADEDGSLVEDEVPERLWDKIVGADANSDGSISAAELASYIPVPPGLDTIFAQWDADSDGSVTSDELATALWADLSKLDTDTDGSVTVAEIAAVLPPHRLPPFHQGSPGGRPEIGFGSPPGGLRGGRFR